jgi:exonuclease III
MSGSTPRLRCLSLNVNGLRNVDKRTALFASLLKPNGSLAYDVVMLQETHHASDNELQSWLSAGAGRGRPVCAEHFHSVGTTVSAGVVVLFATHLRISNSAVTARVAGRLLVVTCSIFEHPFCFVNVYAPHEPEPRVQFFSSTLASHLPDASVMSDTTCLWAGDWNCIEQLDLDQSSRSPLREQGFANALAPILSLHSMQDAFRHMHPHQREFSFSRVPALGAATYSRLDRWYVNDAAVPMLHDASYHDSLPSVGVDHRACVLSIQLPNAPSQGPGVWSFPHVLLWDDACLQQLRTSAQSWLACHTVGSAVDRWLQLKLHIKHQSIMIGMRHKRQQLHAQRVAQRAAALAAAGWAASPSCRAAATAYQVASTAASVGGVDKARRAAKLAGVAWEDYGEKCTAWFHRLGRQRKQATVINSVRVQGAPGAPGASRCIDLSDEAHVGAGGDAIADFFDSQVPGSLFHPGVTDTAAQQDLLGALNRALSDADRATCEAALTLQELHEALKACATSKRPGLDGLPYELYSALWDDLGPCLLAAWHECMASADPHLPASMLEGCVVLLYKGTGDRSDLSNYRPITLLNSDYKLIAKAYARRFGGPAASVVDDTQTAFIPGRWIGDNVLHHLEEVDYSELQQQPACIVFLDFAKAYDRMSRQWLFTCMQHMGFGPKALAVVKCLLAGTRARCLFNGHLTRSFAVDSGVAQGSPLSPLLYVLAAQPMAAKVRQLQQQQVFHSVRQPDGQPAPAIHQHADDTTLHARSAEDAETIVQQAVQPFCRATNAKLNPGKTQVLLLGGAATLPGPSQSGILYPAHSDPAVAVRHLGIMLGPASVADKARQDKFISIEGAMRSRMGHWSQHTLSPLGRAHVAKQCLASMFVYHATFSRPPQALINRLDSSLANFVQKGAFYPSRQIAQLPTAEGGIKLVCVPAAVEALQANIARKYLCDVRKSWHVYWDFWLGRWPARQSRLADQLQYGARLLLMPVPLRSISPGIPNRVLDHVKSLRMCGIARTQLPTTADNIVCEPVWYNLSSSPGTIQGFLSPSKYPGMFAFGVRLVADLHRLWLAREHLTGGLSWEVCSAYDCIPSAWQDILSSHAMLGASLSIPLHHYTVGGCSFLDASVRSLTLSCIHMRAKARHGNTSFPYQPSLWSSDISVHALSNIEQQWVDTCIAGPSGPRGVVRVRDEHIGEAIRAGAAWIDDGRRTKRPRPAPGERSPTEEAGPQHSRGPPSAGPQPAIHTSWWRSLGVSISSGIQPSPPRWEGCWQSIWGRGLTRKAVWVLWCLAHAGAPCRALQRYRAINARRTDVPDGHCGQPECGQAWETLTHGYLECPRVHTIWEWVAGLWVAVSGDVSPPLTAAVLLCGQTRPTWRPKTALWFVLRGIALCCIQKARERAYVSGLHISPARVCCCIVNALRSHMRTEWIAATRCHAVRALYGTPVSLPSSRLRKFKARWARNDVLCVISTSDTVLDIRLTPHFPHPVPPTG